MAFFRFTRDKRGYEHFYLVEPTTNRRGKVRQRVLYWFRSPPDIRVGREPFDEGVRRALEAQNPDVTFDWRSILEAPIPSADADKWRERRRAERAAKQALASASPDEEPAEPDESETAADEREPAGAPARGDRAEQPQAGSSGRTTAARKKRRRRRARRRADGRRARPTPPHRVSHATTTVHPRPANLRKSDRDRAVAPTDPVGRGPSRSPLIVVWWAGREIAPRMLAIVSRIHDLGPAAPVAFILIYVVAVVALIPASLLTIAAGAVFGLLPGALYAFAGALIGSTAAFLLGAPHLPRSRRRRLATMPRFARGRAGGQRARGAASCSSCRLSPLVPFNLLNYALGLTTISLTDFVVASVGMIPGTLVYTYGGKVTGEALALAGQAQVPKNASYYVLLLGGLAATVAATTVATRTARRALRDV